MSIVGAMAVGLLAGTVAGLMGVGGGVLFVPALTIFLGKSQVQAEATSLLAILPVAVVGAWRQSAYGNLHLVDAVWIGVLSLAGVAVGTVVANTVPERALEIGFAFLILFVAYRLAVRGVSEGRESEQADSGSRRGGSLKMD